VSPVDPSSTSDDFRQPTTPVTRRPRNRSNHLLYLPAILVVQAGLSNRSGVCVCVCPDNNFWTKWPITWMSTRHSLCQVRRSMS